MHNAAITYSKLAPLIPYHPPLLPEFTYSLKQSYRLQLPIPTNAYPLQVPIPYNNLSLRIIYPS